MALPFTCLFYVQVVEGGKSLWYFAALLCCSSISWSGLAPGGTNCRPFQFQDGSADKHNLGFYTTRWRSGWQQPSRNGRGRNRRAGRRQRPEIPAWTRHEGTSGTGAKGIEKQGNKAILAWVLKWRHHYGNRFWGLPEQQTSALLAVCRHTHQCNWPSWVLTAVRHAAACLRSAGRCLPPWRRRWRGKAGSISCSEHRCSCSPTRSGDQNVGHIYYRPLQRKSCLVCDTVITNSF